MMEDMRNQFLDLLSDIGFVDKSKGDNVSLLLVLLFAGFLLLLLLLLLKTAYTDTCICHIHATRFIVT